MNISGNLHIFEDFKKAIDRLKEVLNLEKSSINRDAAIKRFELCFDLASKSAKAYAKLHGLDCYSPRDCFKTAFQLKLIEYDEEWLKMIEDRNLSVHVYNEELAENVYSHLPEYLKLFQELLSKLENLDL